jgi:hypothetical protein
MLEALGMIELVAQRTRRGALERLAVRDDGARARRATAATLDLTTPSGIGIERGEEGAPPRMSSRVAAAQPFGAEVGAGLGVREQTARAAARCDRAPTRPVHQTCRAGSGWRRPSARSSYPSMITWEAKEIRDIRDQAGAMVGHMLFRGSRLESVKDEWWIVAAVEGQHLPRTCEVQLDYPYVLVKDSHGDRHVYELSKAVAELVPDPVPYDFAL